MFEQKHSLVWLKIGLTRIRVRPILFHQLSAIEEPEGRKNGCLAVLLVLPFGFLCHICIVAFFSISALRAARCCTLASCLHDSGYFWNLTFCYTNRFSVYTKPVNPLAETALDNCFPAPGGGGVLPLMAYTGRLRPKGVLFSGFRCMKGSGFHMLKNKKYIYIYI